MLAGSRRWLVWQVGRLSSSLSSAAQSVDALMTSSLKCQGRCWLRRCSCGLIRCWSICILQMAGMGCPKCQQEQYRLATWPRQAQRCSPFSQRWHGRLKYTRRQQQHVCRGFLDEISDFMNAGRKLRRWYGEEERPTSEELAELQGQTRPIPQPEPQDNLPRTAILVTDADSPLGEAVVLQLILARAEVKVLVRDAEEARRGYGPYVSVCGGNTGDVQVIAAAMRGVKTVVCPGKLGCLPEVMKSQQPTRLVLLSSAGGPGAAPPLGRLLGGSDAVLADPAREQAVQQADIPCTTVRTGKIMNAAGGRCELLVQLPDSSSSDAGSISREDLGKVVAEIAQQEAPHRQLIFQVKAGNAGRPPQDWGAVFLRLQQQLASLDAKASAS